MNYQPQPPTKRRRLSVGTRIDSNTEECLFLPSSSLFDAPQPWAHASWSGQPESCYTNTVDDCIQQEIVCFGMVSNFFGPQCS